MLSMEKIKSNVNEKIITTINDCVKLQELEILKKWLTDLQKEIERKELLKENTYSLNCEKYYLQSVLN